LISFFLKLFDYLASCIGDFVKSIPGLDQKRLPFGFTFSFGYDQQALDKGVSTQFGLNTSLPDAVGKDVVQFLRDALKRSNLNIDVLAILNDTTAALVAGMFMDPAAAIGLILGSGTNISYREKIDRIGKIDPKLFKPSAKHVIINTECGLLGDNGSMNFAKTEFDLDIDRESLFPFNYGLV
jgi:hexokinase